MDFNVCFLVTSACCTSIPTNFSRKASLGNSDELAVCAHIVQAFKSVLKSAKISKTIQGKFCILKCFLFPWPLALRLNFNALWRQASARKIGMYAMLKASLDTALFFTRTTQHGIIVFENSPQNCENVCEYRTYYVCVIAACLHINSK